MAKFVFNGKALSEDNYVENLMIKRLLSRYGDCNRVLSTNQFLSELEHANITTSLDSAILILKKFGYDISNPTSLERLKPYLTKCTAKSILMLNKNIKDSKINKASFYRASKAYTSGNLINEAHIDSRKFSDDCDYLVNYLTNAILCGEIIYSAETNAIKTLQEQKLELEKETITVVDNYVRNNLNLNAILNATTPTDLAKQLSAYNKQNTPTKK